MTEGNRSLHVEAVDVDGQEMFVAWLMIGAGIREQSRPLTEPKMRARLREAHGEADSLIDRRITLAREERAQRKAS